ncbi:hypothetical protein PZH36_13190 [Ruminococcus bromii]|uniref:hypothetical protein n=1 Tax=Ruminococcus bromii TaxID=40518 RepID=UPI002930F100|nr:hypothetical protein [Ruminococcus bromii]MDE8728057.1 hypothetical protein [Ruminococcus bromii]
MLAFTKNSTSFFFLALYNNGISTGTDTFHLAIRRFRMCKSKAERFLSHLPHLISSDRYMSKKCENVAINEDFSEFKRKKVLIAANHFYMLYRFRRELIEALQVQFEVVVAAPLMTGEEAFEAMGIDAIIKVDTEG